jgi:hypothetical protein
VLWWLVAWAVLANDASALSPLQGDVDFSGEDFNVPGYQNVFQNLNSAINSTKAAAGLGALEWLLFVATLVFLGETNPLPASSLVSLLHPFPES